MSKMWPFKDPDEVLDYQVEWATSTAAKRKHPDKRVDDHGPRFGADAGKTTINGTKTTVWLSGGTLNATYSLTNRITTDGCAQWIRRRA